MTIDEILGAARLIPVIEIDDAARAGDLGRALLAGGVRVAELTLRTPAALDALTVMKAEVPGLIVGMGTIITPGQAGEAASAGADFLVTPGTTPRLIEAVRATGLPALPGVATVGEAIAVLEAGFAKQKFFPAEAAGGVTFLKSIAGPVPAITFCPTGGISAEKARDYLGLPNVACVGGSWVAPRAMIASGDWAGVEENARQAASLQARRGL